jgi:hypothetical protein
MVNEDMQSTPHETSPRMLIHRLKDSLVRCGRAVPGEIATPEVRMVPGYRLAEPVQHDFASW